MIYLAEEKGRCFRQKYIMYKGAEAMEILPGYSNCEKYSTAN